MGSYYTLGVIQTFTAQSKKPLSEEKWKLLLNERIDLELFEITLANEQISGVLKDKLFADNIEDFYGKLKKITRDSSVDTYFKKYGTQRDNYPCDRIRMYLRDDENDVMLNIEYVSLFIEGKVLAETFSIEPTLINWLFRHSDFGNCLAGSIISAID